jgi:hypothetical protein
MPNLPPVLYAGPERLKRIKITPLPPSDVIYEGIGEYHQCMVLGIVAIVRLHVAYQTLMAHLLIADLTAHHKYSLTPLEAS